MPLDPDSDRDPSIFIIDIQDANKKLIFSKMFFCIGTLFLFEGTFTSFFKGKVRKKSQNSYYFCSMIEGSGSRKS
jgi:hypothetical protein